MKKLIFLLAFFGAVTSAVFADQIGKSFVVKTKPVVRTSAQMMAYERAYGPMRPVQSSKDLETEHEYFRSNLQSNPGSPAVAQWPVPQNDVAVIPPPIPPRKDIGPLFGIAVNFSGQKTSDSNIFPPDPCGDASLSSLIVATNGRIRTYDRLGNLTSLDVTFDTFFAPLAAGGSMFDPRVVFDRISKRWFVQSLVASNVNNSICLAVSNSELLNSSTVWTLVRFPQNVGAGPSGFADFCTLGVDANGVYIGSNRFVNSSSSFAGCDVFAVDKAQLLQAVPVLAITPFRNVTSPGGTIFSPYPCTNDDPAASSCLVVGVGGTSLGVLNWNRISYSASTFSISSSGTLTVPTTAVPLAIPHNPKPLNSNDERLLYARVFRNRLTGEVNVHCAHNVRMTSAGVGSSTGDRTGARWYNLGNIFSGALALTAAGTVVDSAATTPLFCTFPSTAMNGQGHQFIGFSVGNFANPAGVGGAYRLAGDPNVTAPTSIVPGVSTYNPLGNSVTQERWGDYSVTCLDPRDMMSMWSFQEYVDALNSWRVRCIKVLAPAPTVSTLTPNNGTQGQTLNVVVAGTGIFDPDNTYPDHLAFSFGANIVVNTVTWNNATQATVNITIGGAAATGARTITLTNPDGQTATGSFTVNVGVKTVSGVLTLQSYAGPLLSGTQFIFEVRDAGTNALIETDAGTIAAGNNFSFTTSQPAGTYRLRIKGVNRFLAKSQSVTLSAIGATGLAYTLQNGDASGDNLVGTPDFNILRAAWGATAPGAPYNIAADFDGDGVIGIADYNILRSSWGITGDS